MSRLMLPTTHVLSDIIAKNEEPTELFEIDGRSVANLR